jgi:predicted MPP superfamily phosphohydrolase
MPERKAVTAADLLRRAAAVYDAPESPLPAAARAAWRRGFAGGGAWMRLSLERLRGRPLPAAAAGLGHLGLLKYALAGAAAAVPLAAALAAGRAWLAVLCVPAFYAVEAQMVFLFPLALDGHERPLAAGRAWAVRAGGTAAVMRVVMPLALAMLGGGLLGRGFVRSWCLGCLAVCLWYEELRTNPPQARAKAGVGPLEVGASGPLLVREEVVTGLGLAAPVRLLYASDLHLGALGSARVAARVVEAARASAPDVIVLGGDLADARRGLPWLRECVRALAAVAPVWAVGGNHDEALGIDLVRGAVEAGGGRWLHGGRAEGVASGLRLDGALAANDDFAGVRILCGHDPAVYPRAVEAGYRLVLAGHLHGGQCVLLRRRGRLYPGALVYRWNGLRFDEGGATLLVSRGAADTLPIRWNCPREVLLCVLR